MSKSYQKVVQSVCVFLGINKKASLMSCCISCLSSWYNVKFTLIDRRKQTRKGNPYQPTVFHFYLELLICLNFLHLVSSQNVPTVSITPSSQYLEELKPAGLICTMSTTVGAASTNSPLSWYRNGGFPNVTTTKTSQQSNGSTTTYQTILTFTPTALDNEVVIVCNASYGTSTGSASYSPLVIIPPDEPVITGPNNTEASENTTWTCKVNGASRIEPNVYWRNRKGEALTTDVNKITTIGQEPNKNQIYFITTTLTLSLPPVESEYSVLCIAVHEIDSYSTTKSATYSVTVYFPPQITKSGGDVVSINEGLSSTLSCIITTSNPAATNVSWTKDDIPLDLNSGLYEPVNTSSPSLTILSATRSDQGNYTCTVTNERGSNSFTTPTKVIVRYPPFINSTGNQTTVGGVAGGSLTIPCPVDAVPLPTAIVWKRIINGKAEVVNVTDNSRYSGGTAENQEYDLTINPLQSEDAGTYFCEAINDVGTVVGPNITTVVNYPPFINSTGNQTTVGGVAGGSLTIPCPVDAVPLPTAIVWRRIINGKTEVVNVTNNSRYSGGTAENQEYDLTINPLQSEDAGTYFCEAVNDVGTVVGPNITTVVNYPPFINSTGNQTTVGGAAGGSLTIPCPVDAVPLPTAIVWRRIINGKAEVVNVTDNSRYSGGTAENQEYDLTINPLQSEDAGTYFCEAVNDVGTVVGPNITTVVNYPPFINSTGNQTTVEGVAGGSLTIPCPVDAVPLPTAIVWKRIINGKAEVVNVTDNSRFSGGTAENQEYDLTINPLQSEDAGTYFCEAVNDVGTVVGPNITTVVNYPPFINSTGNQTTVEGVAGGSLTIPCPVDAVPLPTAIVWRRIINGKAEVVNVTDNSRFSGGTAENQEYDLTINPLQSEDAGTYFCEAVNDVGTVVGPNITTVVNYPPFINSTGNQTTVGGVAGGSLTIPCPVDAVPLPTAIVWRRIINGKAEVVNVTDNSRYSGGTAENQEYDLTINPLQSGDAGTYFCEAVNNLGTVVGPNITTVVSYPPFINSTGNQTTVGGVAGGSLTIPCPVDAVPLPTAIVWRRIINGKAEVVNVTDNSRYSGGTAENQEYDLTINPLQSEDAGTYFCEAVNNLGTVVGPNITTVINYPPFINSTGNQTTVGGVAGGSLTIPCPVDAVTLPTAIVWKRIINGKPEVVNVTDNSRYSGGTAENQEYDLTINPLQSEDAGTYFCEAINDVGTVVGPNITTVVNYVPKVSVSTSNINGSLGETVTLHCFIDAVPPATNILWLHHKIDSNNTAVEVTGTRISGGSPTTPSLTISDAQPEDMATYYCVASNSLGNSTSSPVNLLIIYKPIIDVTSSPQFVKIEETFNLNCTASAYPESISYEWFQGDVKVSNTSDYNKTDASISDYTDFRCTVTNDIGSSSKTIRPNIQFSPQLVGSGQVTIIVKINTNITLECFAFANPEPTSYYWYKLGTLIPGEQQKNMSKLLSKEADFGTYACGAQNIIGQLIPARQFTVLRDKVTPTHTSDLSPALIVLIVLVILIFLIILILLIVCCCLHGTCAKKRKKSKVNPMIVSGANKYNGESPLPPFNSKPNVISLNDDDDDTKSFANSRKKPSSLNHHGNIISVPDKTGARPYHLPPLGPDAESAGVNFRHDEKRRSRRKRSRKQASEDKSALTLSEERIDTNSPTTHK